MVLKLVKGSRIVQQVNEMCLNEYGEEKLINKTIEEFIELLDALIKNTKGMGDYDNLVEEMGDSMIMMYQMMYILELKDPDFTDKMNKSMYGKLVNKEFELTQ